LSELGSVNVLINNAGMGTRAKPALEKHLTEIANDEWDHEIAVSLKTAFLVTKAFLPAMLAEGYGRIVTGLRSLVRTCRIRDRPHTGRKAGMVGLTHALALGRLERCDGQRGCSRLDSNRRIDASNCQRPSTHHAGEPSPGRGCRGSRISCIAQRQLHQRCGSGSTAGTFCRSGM
jgi:hypothetical protein